MKLLGLIFSTYIALMPQTVHAQTVVPPALLCIIEHESGGEQFTASGKPLISRTGDIGVFQINLKTWKPLADKMGLDIVNNAQDNIAFGIWLYNREGPSPWTTYRKYCESDA